MPKFDIQVTCVISETIPVEAENEEFAKERAKEIFNLTSGSGRTEDYMLENIGALVHDKLVRGYRPEELCDFHDGMPKVMVAGKLKCPRCEGAFGGND